MLRPLNHRVDRLKRPVLDYRFIPIALVLTIVAIVLVIPTPFNVGVLAAPVALLTFLAYPVLLPLALVATVPIQDAIPVPEGIPVTATRAMVAIVIAVLPFALIRRTTPLVWSRFLLLPALLLLVMAFSLLNAESVSAGGAELYHWATAGLAFWLVLQFVQSRRHLLVAVMLVGLLAILQGGFGLVQSVVGMGPASFQIGAGFSRSFGTFGMPNSFAAYMEMVTLPLVPVGIWAMSRFWQKLRAYRMSRLKGYLASTADRRALLSSAFVLFVVASGAIVGLASIAMSFSRGAWIGTLAALAVVIVLLGKRVIASSAFIAAVLSFALFIGAPGEILSAIEERFSQIVEQVQIGDIRGVPVTDDNFATVERMAHWQTAIAMWDAHPWLGVGAGNFDERFPDFFVHPQFDESQGHAHNYYLHLLAETGAIGLLTYLALLVATLLIGWKAYRERDPLARAIGIGAIGLTVALAMHNIFENLHVLNISMQMMLIWAIALIATRLSRQQDAEPDSQNRNTNLLYDSGRMPGMQYGSVKQWTARERN